jgi:hypothetical protein
MSGFVFRINGVDIAAIGSNRMSKIHVTILCTIAIDYKSTNRSQLLLLACLT